MSNEILTTGATASLQSQSISEADNNSNNDNNNNNNNNTESKALTVGTSTSTLSTLPLPLPLANTRTRSNSLVRSRFAECALIEIIHLHDCLRGALWKIQKDVQTLVQSSSYIGLPSSVLPSSSSSSLLPLPSSDATSALNASTSGTFEIPVAADLSNSVASRFHLIWSVFQAHSGAEDEFIWPALKMKIESKKLNKETSTSSSSSSSTTTTVPVAKCGCESSLEQEEYEEDHALEETMFKQILTTLRRLNGSFRYYHANVNKQQQNSNSTSTTTSSNNNSNELSYLTIIKNVILQLKEQTDNLTQHLEQHLKKEETQCLPMVRKHLTDEEISHLVGNIMGKRSAEVMSKILNLAVCSLPAEERDDMVQHMKKAMVGTFFEKWLTMGGWVDDAATHYGDDAEDVDEMMDVDADADAEESKTTTDKKKRKKRNGISSTVAISPSSSIASLPKDSKRKHSTMIDTHPDDHDLSHTHTKKPNRVYSRHVTDSRLRYPSRYYIKTKKNKVVLIWNSLDPQSNDGSSKSNTIPQFTQSELTPTYHFSETKGCLVLGCEHYTRDCKLRHPITGELYTCRLCCEEIRETHLHGYNDHHDNSTLPQLDRYAVKEVLCMKCGSLQPASQSCVNSECDSYNTNTIHSSSSSSSSNSNSSSSRSQKPFAKYYCSICHLYDDSDKHPIYHCPYCNVCRKGHGLGIDFRHCMRCNACISIDEYAQHVCIPQRLQANCPICHDSMFQSTEPLRGMKCGHVMHLSCFNQYVSRGILGKLKCPLCKSSFDKLRG